VTPGTALITIAAVWHIAACAASLALYAIDKRRARVGARRVRERTLHTADLLGGWPGGLIARRALRHKTRARRFVRVFWVTVLTHLALVALIARLVSRVIG